MHDYVFLGILHENNVLYNCHSLQKETCSYTVLNNFCYSSHKNSTIQLQVDDTISACCYEDDRRKEKKWSLIVSLRIKCVLQSGGRRKTSNSNTIMADFLSLVFWTYFQTKQTSRSRMKNFWPSKLFLY